MSSCAKKAYSRKQICSHCEKLGPQDVVMPALQQDVALLAGQFVRRYTGALRFS